MLWDFHQASVAGILVVVNDPSRIRLVVIEEVLPVTFGNTLIDAQTSR